MVSQKRSAMSVGSRVSKGKENIQSEKLHRPDEIFVRRIELGISIIRQKIKLRVDRCQELLEKLDKDCRQMKICFLQLMDVIESSRKLVNNEKEENIQLLQLLDAGYTGKVDMSSKTQTVNPMIGGLPLKRASISLKRLDPFRELHSHNNTTVILADSLPASNIGFPQPSSSSPLHQSVRPHPMHSQSEDQAVADSSSSAVLPRHRGRYRRWHAVHGSVLPGSRKDLHLKRASIHLKRLDLRSYLPERDIEEVLDSQNMPFEEEGVVGNEVFEADHLGNTTESDHTATRQSVCPESGRKCVRCVPHSSDPMVVLERLAPSSPEGSDTHNQNTNSYLARSGVCSMFGNCQMRNDLSSLCETRIECRNNCESTQKDVQHPHQGHETKLNRQRKRRAQESYGRIKMKKHIQNNKLNSERRTKKIGVPNNNKVKKKRSSTKKSKVEIQFPATDTTANPPETVDEDPLEGPSWLYKDGVLKKAKLRKLKKIRQNYLTPFYYLAPTIYSSTDESDDETNDKGKKANKLRKRKQKKKNC